MTVNTDWRKQSFNRSDVPKEIINRIIQLRRQMLVHCCIYYKLNSNIIDDHQWQHRAEELTNLQAQYGHEFGFYDNVFFGWDASTGYHLPSDYPIRNVAKRLLRYARVRPESNLHVGNQSS